ncbi:hypothetical protein DH2020_013550 [Rehmannia glutinosa]|uniref:Protein FAR1-RELATED SEQUENCE n=1 Tax=Rehmannia glutinosa TaxID=99300 RepID=A0ABR0X3W8_REHGL
MEEPKNAKNRKFCVLQVTAHGRARDLLLFAAHQLESRLAVGQVVRSVEDAYLLYCNYAHAKGFSVKKGNKRYFPRTGELQSKEFECSCEGGKDEKRSSRRLPVYQKPKTRTKCKARLRITREQGGEWKVAKLVIEHNHEMVAADQTHLLRSSRNISHAQKSTLEAMVNAGISVANVVSYMENEAQGPQNLRFTRKDAYDHLDRLRKHTKVENGDASALLQYFINKSNKKPYFYWNVQLDDDNRVMNFFFRDYRCRIDYDYFGDVLSVDTTYRTTKYNLICAPFVGINHHKQNVMFGLAFMSDETESSFEWLFKTFLESMSEEVEATWKTLIDEYNLSGHKWLNGMYKLRHKWATAFTNEKFMRDSTTSRSEGTNSVLKKAGKASISLYTFIQNYEKIQNSWRAKEKVEDTRCRHGKASMILKNNPLLKCVADIYTLTIYMLFEMELINSLNTSFIEPPSDFGFSFIVFKVNLMVQTQDLGGWYLIN